MTSLESRIGYEFRDPALLQLALTHASFVQDQPGGAENNQRLEFLGDAVVQLVLTEALYRLFPEEREGVLSKRRAVLTKGAFLARIALEIGIDRHLRLGASEEGASGREKSSTLEDAFEALVGAIYHDGGLDAARGALLRIYGDLPRRLAAMEGEENPKGRLQEIVQPLHGNHALRYEVVDIRGAEHARAFEVEVYLNDKPIGRGQGSSKKQAEESAAKAALASFPAATEGP